MPYSIDVKDGQFLVVSDSGETMGTHATRQQAIDQQRALYANVADSTTKEEYPFDECVADQMKRYGDEETARKVCGSIRARYGKKELSDPQYREIESELGIMPKEVKPSIVDRIVGFFKEGRRNATADESRLQQIHDLAVENGASCPMVFKQANGQSRWILLSTNSYQDRDGEIVTQKSQEADTERMTTTRNYGPLRLWHLGYPDTSTKEAGPGIDVGDCDYSQMFGRVRVESGTFRDERTAAAIKGRADQWAGSIGFFHPVDQPDRNGEYSDIYTFERSLLPRGRQSNYFAPLAAIVKENSMTTKDDKIKQLADLLGDNALADTVVKQAEATEKAAQERGLRFKEGAEAATADEVGVTTKAPKKPAKKAKVSKGGKKSGSGKKGGGGSGSDDQTKAMFARLEESGERTSSKAAIEPDDDEAETEVDADEIFAALKEDISALIDERLAASRKEYTEKEVGQAAQVKALEAQVKELIGDQPRGFFGGFRPSTSEATVLQGVIQTKEAGDPLDSVINQLMGKKN